MIATRADIDRLSPFRPLDWRWRRAQELVACGRNYCVHRDDELTGRAMQYLRAAARCTTDREKTNLRQRMPDVVSAWELYDDAGSIGGVVQASVLARQSPTAIARRVSRNTDDIVAYEQLFFDVRDRLNAKYFIHMQALGGSDAGKTRQQRDAAALKSMAYYGGPLVLDAVEAVLLRGVTLSARTDCDQADALHAARVRLLAGLLTMPDDENQTLVLRMTADLAKATQLDGTITESPFAAATEQFLTETQLELQELDLGEGAPEPVKDDALPNDSKIREAA